MGGAPSTSACLQFTPKFVRSGSAELVVANWCPTNDAAQFEEEHFVGVPEQGGRNMISSDPLPPGTVYSASVATDGTVGLFRIEVSLSSGAAKLNKNATKILDKAILALDEFPDASLSVEAHTDAEGSERSNQQLSESRAKAVSSYLTTKLKLPKGQIGAVGYGESRPIADNDTPSGRARNRRVEIVVSLPR